MKKIFVYLGVMFYLLTATCIASAAQRDVRNVNWVMSKEQVFSLEKNAIFKEDGGDVLIYRCVLNEKNYTLLYYFDNNKLNYVYFIGDQDIAVYDDYDFLKTVLSKKYGNSWMSDLSDNETMDYIDDGEYVYDTYTTAWKNKRTIIILKILSRFNEEISSDVKRLEIIYINKAYIDSQEKAKYNNAANGL